MRQFLAILALAALVSAAAEGPAAWPQFRGPGALGVAADDPRLPDAWSATENLVWRVPIPGLGWSSPIVWGDRVIVTTAVEQGQTEPPRQGLYLGGERPAPKTSCRWLVLCLDVATGKVLWEVTAHEGVPGGARHTKNSFASETPVTDGERVYAYFGNTGLFVYDMDGKPRWSKRWEPVTTRGNWGTAASPVLHGDRLYIVNDNENQSWLVALDKRTGEQVWRVERQEKSNWSTPYVWVNDKRTEIVTPGTGKTRSYDLDGKLLWELTGASGITIPSPFAKFGLLYVASGFLMGSRQPLWAIRPGGSGDITPMPGETETDAIAWWLPRGAAYNPSPLVYGEELYVLLDGGLLSCYDAKTGEVRYERERLPGSGSYTVSPWAYNGWVFCLAEDGGTRVLKAGKTFQPLGRNALDEMCLACPALANGSLFIRTAAALYRLQK
jgi:outer membrane protein assembly factor BamB